MVLVKPNKKDMCGLKYFLETDNTAVVKARSTENKVKKLQSLELHLAKII